MSSEEGKVLKAFSYAKINLGLEVLYRRPDGYHEIRTLFQTINFHDVLEFRLAPPGVLKLEGDNPLIPWDETNLIYQAACRLEERFKPKAGVKIKVNKIIPVGSGLGGGSSNAAVTLLALNHLWNLNLPLISLIELARSLGADVAYFLTGGLCLGEGRGDLISPLTEFPPFYCLLVCPDFSISTALIYNYYDQRATLTKKNQPSRIIEFLEKRRLRFLVNELEEVIFDLYPELKKIKEFLLEQEPLMAGVSGTGSAVFALFLEKEKAERALVSLKGQGKTILTTTLPRKDYRPLIL